MLSNGGLSPASRVLALSLFVLAVVLNHCFAALSHRINWGDRGKEGLRMAAKKIVFSGACATALTTASVLSSVVATAAPG